MDRFAGFQGANVQKVARLEELLALFRQGHWLPRRVADENVIVRLPFPLLNEDALIAAVVQGNREFAWLAHRGGEQKPRKRLARKTDRLFPLLVKREWPRWRGTRRTEVDAILVFVASVSMPGTVNVTGLATVNAEKSLASANSKE